MLQLIQILTGICVLVLGIPLGNFLAKMTKEELKSGQRWFKLIIIFSFIGAIIFLILREDTLLFTMLFIAVVTSRSLKKK
ncbi:MAG: hypothetical protein KKF67_02740 [Nanoarchaeota archaeon]|nr:hypothetical protein [Nanoarchaeota archaeon]